MKKSSRKKVIILLLCFMALMVSSFFILRINFHVKNYEKEISYEYKDDINYNSINVCFGNILSCEKVDAVVEGKVDSTKLGKYKIKYTYKHNNKTFTLNQTVNVIDSTPPEITCNIEKVSVCPNGIIPNFDIKAIDNYDGDVTSTITKEYSNNEVIIKATDKHGNVSVKNIPSVLEDNEGPKIEINGQKEKTFYINSSYNDEGISVTDNCDAVKDISISSENNIDFNSPGSYKIIYKATDKSNNTSTDERLINVIVPSDNSNEIYLTFDDGPSIYTDELLDILKKYNVKATFFVTSNGSDSTILREYNEGHTIGLHTNSHDYSYVYSSIDNYFADLYAIQNRVKNVTGEAPNLIRFPGGSSNTVSTNYDGGIGIMSRLAEEVEKRGFYYFDWNVSSGDAGGASTSDEVYSNVVNSLGGGYSIVLQHDTKKFSIDAVERIIEYGLNNGYTFKTLSPGSPKAHHRIFN